MLSMATFVIHIFTVNELDVISFSFSLVKVFSLGFLATVVVSLFHGAFFCDVP